MKSTVITASDKAWSEGLSRLRHDFYHQPGFHLLEAERLGGDARAIVIESGEALFFAPFLLRDVPGSAPGASRDATPVYGYPGLLASPDALASGRFMKEALGYLKMELAKLDVCAAFLPLHPILSNKIAEFIPSGEISELGKTVSFDLNLDEGTLWAQIKKGHRGVLNKCKRIGLESSVVSYQEGLDELIETYLDTMNRVAAKNTYFFERSYFERLKDSGEEVHLCHVKRDGLVAAACVFFERCGIMQAHLGGTKTVQMRHSPFSYLFYSMALWGKERGLDYLHIGGGVGGSNDRLLSFKEGFSRLRHDWLAWRLIIDVELYEHQIAKRAKELRKKLEDIRQEKFFPLYRIDG